MTIQSPTKRHEIELLLPHRAVDPVMSFFDPVYVFLITELNDAIRAESG